MLCYPQANEFAILIRTKHLHYQVKSMNLCTHITAEFTNEEWEAWKCWQYYFIHQVSVSNTFDGSSPSYICEEARKHSKGHDAALARTNGRISCRMTAKSNWNMNMIRLYQVTSSILDIIEKNTDTGIHPQCKSIVLKHPGNKQEKIHLQYAPKVLLSSTSTNVWPW